MPVWGTVLLAVLGGWILLSVLVALAVGRAIRIADQRTPRKPRRRLKSGALAHLDDARAERDHDRRRSSP